GQGLELRIRRAAKPFENDHLRSDWLHPGPRHSGKRDVHRARGSRGDTVTDDGNLEAATTERKRTLQHADMRFRSHDHDRGPPGGAPAGERLIDLRLGSTREGLFLEPPGGTRLLGNPGHGRPESLRVLLSEERRDA